MKKLFIFFAAMIITIVILILDQVWFHILSESIFIKSISTLGFIVIAVLLIYLVYKELIEDKNLKDKGYFD